MLTGAVVIKRAEHASQTLPVVGKFVALPRAVVHPLSIYNPQTSIPMHIATG